MWKAEEKRRKAEEEQKHRETDETQRKAEEEDRPKGEVESKWVEPVKRGGRSRDLTQDREKQPPQERKARAPKPEIVCWKRIRQWIPAVEVPEDLLKNPGLAVLQNELPLTQDESSEGCLRLEQACGQVTVQWSEDEIARGTRIDLGEENYLLFKLSGQNQNQGRRVKSPSSGSYLVIVPDNWERDDALSGPPPVAPEAVSFPGYQAHFYIIEKDGHGKIAFRTRGDRRIIIESKASRFDLVGTRLDDVSEDMGPLFGEKPPKIRALNDHAWKDVGTIVVGEEGSVKGRWRTQFNPVAEGLEQDLPSEVAVRKGGWYFLRFYDTNDDPLESLDFRFIGGLKDIKVHQPPPLPLEGGHTTVSVELMHEPDCLIQPAGGSDGSVQIRRESEKTILTVPPDPTCDETRWLVGPKGGPHVEVTILVERLWWAVGEEDNSPSHWEDQLLTLVGDEFAATSDKRLWLRLPRRRWTDDVLVGFDESRADRCPVQVTRRDVAKPLCEFVTFEEIADREHEHLLKVWIKRDDRLVEKAIAIIPAEPPVVVRQESPGSRLNLARISAPRLAGVLSRLQRVTSGPLFILIKETRKAYPRAHVAHPAGSVNFVKKALCIIAFSLELGGEGHPEILRLKNRWTVRARRARDEYPEVMSQLRNRYEKLKTSRSH
ncbi:MAG: hypothetical protein HY665_08725 [Chloroflexi bacterium]|nr:hypothetical protein [Chloroflexota bacterium]